MCNKVKMAPVSKVNFRQALRGHGYVLDRTNGGHETWKKVVTKLPIKYAIFCVEGCKMHGYDIDEVYGLIDSCWKETVKEIKEVA